MEKLRKEIKEWWELRWLWFPILIALCVVVSFLYYKAHYCKEIPYNAVCKECVEWKEVDNGYQGKYRRTWEECVQYEYYDCVRTYDSCGCDKIE